MTTCRIRRARILKKQVKRLDERGDIGYFASELEFYLFNETYESARKKHWQGLETARPISSDYQIGIPPRKKASCARLRNEMEAAGIPIENSKGEWGPGQEEINVRYAEALDMADRHVILKNGAKEIAESEGKAISSCPSTITASPAIPATSTIRCGAPMARHRCSSTRGGHGRCRRSASNGRQASSRYAKEFTWFLAPYINSYKRFQAGTFAPTKIMWSEDNRTAGFRLCGEGTKGIRMECRIGGADFNPYLAFAALIAAGLAGIDEKLELQKPFVGDAYQASRLPRDPEDAARRHRDAGQVEDAEARRSARTCSNIMSTPPSGSSSNTTAALRIGNCTGGSSGTKLCRRLPCPWPLRLGSAPALEAGRRQTMPMLIS